MKRVAAPFIIAAFLTASPVPAEQVTLEGYLVDRECSSGIIELGAEAAAKHDRSCALMEICVQSGFGILTAAGEFVIFDDAGNEKAVAEVESASKDKDYKIRVSGAREGDEIQVASLTIE